MSNAFLVDGFFDDPVKVREFAMAQDFSVDQFNFPGKRTKLLEEINPELYQVFKKKILNLIGASNKQCRLYAAFQYTPAQYERGWVHLDAEVDVAGVVYLSPDAPVNAGTSIYRLVDDYEPAKENWVARDSFYDNNLSIPLEEYQSLRDTHNAKYEKTLAIGNVFNRLAMYSGKQYHKEDSFFGDTKEDSRLTLVFFMQLKENA